MYLRKTITFLIRGKIHDANFLKNIRIKWNHFTRKTKIQMNIVLNSTSLTKKSYALPPRDKLLPVALTERIKTKLVSYFRCIHCIREILFVGEDEQHSISQFILKSEMLIKPAIWKTFFFHKRQRHLQSSNVLIQSRKDFRNLFNRSVNKQLQSMHHVPIWIFKL